MRRQLKDSPKGVERELNGNLVRATINPTGKVLPLNVTPYQPYLCPVCGADAGLTDRMATILALEFEDGSMKDFPVWSHRKCFDACPEIVEA